MKKSERKSNIELLRIFAIIGVIILHYIASPGHILQNLNGGADLYSIVFVNSVFVCAVDLFIFICGYFMWKATYISIRKPIQLISEVVAFQEIVVIISGSISLKSCVAAFLPKNYFVTLYVTLYLIVPLVNKVLGNLTKEQYQYWLMVLLLLFSVEPTLVDIIEGLVGKNIIGISTIGAYGAEWGYTIITFLLMYLTGAYYGRYKVQWSKVKSLGISCGVVMLLTIWKLCEIRIGRSIGAEHYQNPLIILEAVAIFMLFDNFKIKNRAINNISKSCFTVFIVHDHIMNKFPILNPGQMATWVLLVNLLIRAIFVFSLSACIGMVYSTAEQVLFDKMEDKWGFYQIGLE